MKRYAGYKRSNIEWIDNIPSHWDISSLKYKTKFINGSAFKPSEWADNGIPIIRIENLNGGEEFNYSKTTIEDKYHVKKGDLLFSWSGNKGTSFGPFLWNKEGLYYLNQHIFKLENYEYDKTYFYWLLKAVTFYVEYKTHGIIGLVHITKQELGSIKIPDLPYEEQKSIANFLDDKTGKIDSLILKKQNIIDLLREERVQIVNEAVTKGINQDIQYRKSKLDWLSIPTHWKEIRAKNVFFESNDKAMGDEELLSVSHYTGITPRSEKNVNMFLAESYEGYKLCKKDDLVINTMWAWMGALGISEYNGIVSAGYGVYRLKDKSSFIPMYLNYLLRTPGYVGEYIKRSKGIHSSRWRLYADQFFQITVICPPIEEQRNIINYIQREAYNIDQTMARLGKEIVLLEEYRAALISEVVTGKIDVRDEVVAWT